MGCEVSQADTGLDSSEELCSAARLLCRQLIGSLERVEASDAELVRLPCDFLSCNALHRSAAAEAVGLQIANDSLFPPLLCRLRFCGSLRPCLAAVYSSSVSAIPFLIDVMNTIHLNMPTVPYLPTRTSDQPDIGTLLSAAPWNAIGHTPISFYPFVIGIAYLLSVEMTFSCWFFWLITKMEAVFGSAAGFSSGAAGSGQSTWPFIGHQGAGAFLALTLVGLWLSRAYLKETWNIAFRGLGRRRKRTDYPIAWPISGWGSAPGRVDCLVDNGR